MHNEKDIASSFKMGLGRDGYRADMFYDPQQALKSYRNVEYDFSSLDGAMPLISGFELGYTIKTMDSKARVWFVTASESCLKDFAEKYPNIEGSMVIKNRFLCES